MDMDLTK